LEVFVFKRVLFVLMAAACAKHSVTAQRTGGSLYGFAGENFSSTNSPCLDGIITVIDHSCAVPMEIEEGYPYITIQCTKVVEGAHPWNQYNVMAIINPELEGPDEESMVCADLYTRVYIQTRP